MQTLVTGANGHIGCHIVRVLLERGHEVRAMVRSGSDRRGLYGLDVEYAEGDIRDAEAVSRSVRGCEWVFHAASPYRIWAKDPQEIIGPALEGTRNVLAAASKHGTAKIMYTSSANAIGPCSSRDEVRDESNWNESYRNPYVTAKNDAERLAWKLAEEYGLDMVSLLPAAVLGPLDYRVTPSTQIVRDIVLGKMPVGDHGANLVHVEDVGEGHVLAAEKGKAGERYGLGGENVNLLEVSHKLRELTGCKPPAKLPPIWVAKIIAVLATGVSKLTGTQPMLTLDVVHDFLGRHWAADTTKMRIQLGLEPRGVDTVLEDTVRWLLFVGELDESSAPAAKDRLRPDPSW